jgi:hypothetical protein
MGLIKHSENFIFYVRFKVVTAVKGIAFWDETPCKLPELCYASIKHADSVFLVEE